MAVRRLFTALMVDNGKMLYAVNGDTYGVREELKKLGYEWCPINYQWEKVLTGGKKDIFEQTKKLNEELKAFNMPVDFDAKRSNIALRAYFA